MLSIFEFFFAQSSVDVKDFNKMSFFHVKDFNIRIVIDPTASKVTKRTFYIILQIQRLDG